VFHYLVESLVVGVKLVHPEFIPHPKENQQRTNEACRQPGQVDKEVPFRPQEVAIEEKQGVLQHIIEFYFAKTFERTKKLHFDNVNTAFADIGYTR